MRRIETPLRFCVECSNPIIRKRVSPTQYNKSKFCGRVCRGKWQSKTKVSGRALNYKGGCSKCIDCDKTLSYRCSKPKRCQDCWYTFNSGKNSPFWKGGVKSYYELLRGSSKMASWRNDVFKRDHYTCTKCGDNKGGNLNADHIKPFAILLKENNINSKRGGLCCEKLWDLSNGRTLCVTCHRKTITYGFGTIKLMKQIYAVS